MSLLSVINGLLVFALIYLLATSVVLLRNRFELTALREPNGYENQPRISICIPARNEEQNIERLLKSLLQQEYKNFEILVLDDHSEDNTAAIVKSLATEHPDLLQFHTGEKKPEDWLGKPWACHQLGKLASGDLILFLDADTSLHPDTVAKISSSFREDQMHMLTVWPQQRLRTFWEKTVIPLVYYALVTLLPAIYVYRDPRWMPKPFRNKFRTAFSAACGQCLAFKREAYEAIGGHESVKENIVEDVELAKLIKKAGFRIRMYHGVETVQCRMYENEKAMFNGFRKNFLAGFGYSVPLFLIAALLHLVVFVLPFFVIPFAWYHIYEQLFFLSAASVGIILLHRLILSIWFRWDPVHAFTHPVGVLWFQRLGIRVLFDYFSGTKPDWKGRKV